MHETRLILALILDISPQNYLGGIRLIKLIKTQLIELAVEMGLSGGLYVSHINNHKVPRRQGESVYQIDEYVEEEGFDVGKAMKRASNVLKLEDPDDQKYIILISDRVEPNYSYKINKIKKNNSVILLSPKEFPDFKTFEINNLKREINESIKKFHEGDSLQNVTS